MSSHVQELSSTLAHFARRCRDARWWNALFHVGVAQDIVADIEKEQAVVRSTVNEAAKFDLEALAEIEAATAKDSDGGSTITPRELRKIKPLIMKSATLDQHAANLVQP